jgi:hypothetical protein
MTTDETPEDRAVREARQTLYSARIEWYDAAREGLNTARFEKWAREYDAALADLEAAIAARTTAERDAALLRAREAAQTIVAAIGASGPEDVGSLAKRIAARLTTADAELRAALRERDEARSIIADARYLVEQDMADGTAMRATLAGNGLEPGVAEEYRGDLDRVKAERDAAHAKITELEASRETVYRASVKHIAAMKAERDAATRALEGLREAARDARAWGVLWLRCVKGTPEAAAWAAAFADSMQEDIARDAFSAPPAAPPAADVAGEPLEALAALEHEQWSAWATSLMASETLSASRIARWKRLATTAYDALTEAEKEQDRVWARKALALASPAPGAAEVVAEIVAWLRKQVRAHWPNPDEVPADAQDEWAACALKGAADHIAERWGAK